MATIDDILCVIPARGGSKSVLNKNLRLLGGMSLVGHSVKHAKRAGLLRTNIVVSSDSENILAEAALHKAFMCKRPDDISGDNSPTEECLVHALRTCEDLFNKKYTHVLLLQATSPIRLDGTLSNFIDFTFEGDYDSSLTVNKFYNFFWKKPMYSGGSWEATYNPELRPMRQKLTNADFRYFDNGNAYLTKSEILLEYNSRLAGKVGVFPITDLEAIQIDTPSDLFLLESIFDGNVSELTKVNDIPKV